jgi:hypothetical protein
MDTLNALMYQNSTLLGAIIIVGALAYVGSNVISPTSIVLRRLVGYLVGVVLLLIGGYAFYFGASKEWALLFAHVYTLDLFRLEWMLVGLLAIIVGFLLARQAYRGM